MSCASQAVTNLRGGPNERDLFEVIGIGRFKLSASHSLSEKYSVFLQWNVFLHPQTVANRPRLCISSRLLQYTE